MSLHRRPRKYRTRRVAAALACAVVATVVATIVVVETNRRSGPPSSAGTATFARVAGVKRVCLIDSGAAGEQAASDVVWADARALAAKGSVLAQRSELPSGVGSQGMSGTASQSARAIALNSALARRCDAVVVVGGRWQHTVELAAQQHHDVRFLLVASSALQLPSIANTRELRFSAPDRLSPSIATALGG